MTQEYKQFWNAMWIILKKDVAPAVLITGLVTLGAFYIQKNKDKIQDKFNKVEKNDFGYNKMMNYYNPFAKTK
jgi:uncharacterized membrane protein